MTLSLGNHENQIFEQPGAPEILALHQGFFYQDSYEFLPGQAKFSYFHRGDI